MQKIKILEYSIHVSLAKLIIEVMTYRASLDKTSKTVTVVISLLFLCILVFQFTNYLLYHDWAALATASLLIIIYFITYLYRPVCYCIENNKIVVHRPASDITILRSDVKKVELINDNKLRGTIRTFGVGGLFGYFGQFINTELGCMTWYATKRSNESVLIELTNNKKIIVTPDEPQQFINDLSLVA